MVNTVRQDVGPGQREGCHLTVSLSEPLVEENFQTMLLFLDAGSIRTAGQSTGTEPLHLPPITGLPASLLGSHFLPLDSLPQTLALSSPQHIHPYPAPESWE